MALSVGILTVSDSCFRKEKDDTAGPRLEVEIKNYYAQFCNYSRKIVPDEVVDIKEALESWITLNYNIIITVGGTGFSPRDVTPEATRAVIEKEAPGIAYAMISKSLAITDMAMLSRAVCGIKSKTIIINFPGSTKAVVECFDIVKKSLLHAVAVLTDNKELIENAHKVIQKEIPPAGGDTSCTQTLQSIGLGISTESKVKLNPANRNRKSPYPMLEVDEALKKVLEECIPNLKKEEIDLNEALHRVLAEDIYAKHPIPPFRASIKDGYAVRASDGNGIRIVRNVITAGDKPYSDELKEGEVIRISTGAPIPLGADAVVQVEDTTLIEKSEDGTQEQKIQINVKPNIGQDIREVGSDIASGQLVLSKYDRISAAYIGVLSMLGKTRVKVVKRYSVGIISTGNELKSPGETLKPGEIYDSNKCMLINLLKEYSYESMDCGVAKDEPNAVKFALEKALDTNDIIITTGGVSMGEHDLVKDVLEQDFDAVIHFGRINMKPGKPTTFATLLYQGQHKMVFALPGNPVSCCVTTLLFVVPTLRYIERSKKYQFPETKTITYLTNNDARPEYHRVSVTYGNDGGVSVTSTGNQISSRLNSLAGANGLAVIPGNTQHYIMNKIILFSD